MVEVLVFGCGVLVGVVLRSVQVRRRDRDILRVIQQTRESIERGH